MGDLISRLNRGIGITNEKLDDILARIEEIETRGENERQIREIIDDLNILETTITQFFQDVDVLKSHQHSDANDLNRQYFF